MTARLGVMLTFVSTGCVTGAPPLEPLLWEARFDAGVGGAEEIGGRALMAANANYTEIAITIDGLEAGTAARWSVRSGACTQEGTRVGPEVAFPDFVVDAAGHGEQETRLNRRVNAGTYSVEVFLGSPQTELACATFVRIEPSDL